MLFYIILISSILAMVLIQVVPLIYFEIKKNKLNKKFKTLLQDIETAIANTPTTSAPKPTISPTKIERQRILENINKLNNLSDEQISLVNQLDYPSRGASHSRWKNETITRLKELEKNKFVILKALLSDGYDAELKYIIPNTGEHKMMKISEMLAAGMLDDDYIDDPVNKNDHIKPSRKLRLIKGNKEHNND